MYSTNKKLYQGCQQQEVKFQDQIFSKFQDNFDGFMRLRKKKMHVFLCSQILISQADQYCSHKNVTKAMLHINNELSQSKTELDTQRQQCKESSYEVTKYRIKAMP